MMHSANCDMQFVWAPNWTEIVTTMEKKNEHNKEKRALCLERVNDADGEVLLKTKDFHVCM